MCKNVYNRSRLAPALWDYLKGGFAVGSKLTLSLRVLLLTLCFSTVALSAPAAEPAALTPPMGWNSWNHFGHRVTDQTIRDTADAMVASGMRDAGYIYVNIDD